MTQKLLKSLPLQKAEEESLFSGVWIRWRSLNSAERLVSANIVLLPVWWVLGLLNYLPSFLMVAIALYEWRRYGKVRLKRPSLVVLTLFAFYIYGYIATFLLFFDAYPFVELPPHVVIEPIDFVESGFTFAIPCLAWYIQSNNIRVRLEVVAWACSVSVVQMLLLWILVQFVFPGALDNPPRSVYGLLTGKSPEYIEGAGAKNYLLVYQEERFRFFFNHYQAGAAFLGFTGIMALDLKNRVWSLLLLVACTFLLSLAATRSVWLALPAVVFIHFLFTVGRARGSWFLLTLIAITSFVTLSLPQVTDFVFNTYEATATAVDNVRPNSTDVRSLIYEKTIEAIPDKLLFGHVVEGTSVTGSPEDTALGPGSHSFILGALLYKGGLAATAIFVSFWVSLIVWLYDTRVGRPLSCFLILLFFSLISSVTILQWTMTTGTLLCMMLRRPTRPTTKLLRRNS